MTAQTPACFNCETTDDVKAYSFDLDLPAIHGCKVCILLLSLGDEEMLKKLRPKIRKARTR